MSENYGADFDVEGFMRNTDAYLNKIEKMQQELTSIVGRAQDEDNLVTVEFGSSGLRELELHPKAMRLSSGELAELIKEVFREAMADLERKTSEAMSAVFGEQENPMRMLKDPEAALTQVKEAEATYKRVFEDAMGELDRIIRRLQDG